MTVDAMLKKRTAKVPLSLKGYLLAFVEESLDGRDICIYGDPEGLRSLGEALIAVAELNQQSLPNGELPPSESFHQHYKTSKRLPLLTIGRVDEKESGQIKDYFADRM